jgi:hypothetical protein
MILLFELWEMTDRAYLLMEMINSLGESFITKLQKGSRFNERFVCTFLRKLVNMNKHKRQKQNLSLNNRLMKIPGGWNGRIEVLWQLIATYDILEKIRRQCFLR